jgi:ATP-binding protein involved in chromosome partitioning
MASPLTADLVQECLREVIDPEIGRGLVELNMITRVEISDDDQVRITVDLPTPAYPRKERIAGSIEAVLAARLPQVRGIEVAFTATVKGLNTGGAIGLRIKNVLAVGSGKGGVGKSTVSAALAVGLTQLGAKVGLLDADIYGPSIPHLLGAHERPHIVEQKGPEGQVLQRMEPVLAHGVRVMSIGFLIGADEPVIVRGPILHRTIEQFLRQTAWGDLDYLIIDLPPGTGDIALSLSQLLGLSGAVVVCTPQQLALLDAVKAVNMFRKVKIPVLGIVENMSGEIFGRGGARRKAEEMGVPFLGELPIDPEIRVQGDAGRIDQLFAEGCASRGHLLQICQQVAIQIARSLLETPRMPALEML